MLDASKGDPSLAPLRPLMERPIAVPTLALCGADDLRAELMTDQGQYFTAEYRYEEVAGAGHFLQREQPAQVNRLLLDWPLHATEGACTRPKAATPPGAGCRING